jgi:hypothetical protein
MEFQLLKKLWVMPSMVVNLLAWWKGKFARHKNDNWNTFLMYIMRCIWSERNAQSFEKYEALALELKLLFAFPL